jgi:hypothetical protein
MLKIYKYILKLNHVENEEYSIVHLLSPTYSSLDNLKSRIKSKIILAFNACEILNGSY